MRRLIFTADLRDRLFDLDMLGLEQDQQLAAERFHAERQALALKIAGETLLLAAKEYGVQVDAIIMAAREYAAVIDREGIELQKQRALMDVKKEGAHLQEVEARLLLELVERRNQEIELAKAKVEVARANIRALMADIQAEEAELRVVRAELEVAQAEADKAGLIADVAQILADIVVRGLAKNQVGGGHRGIGSRVWLHRTASHRYDKHCYGQDGHRGNQVGLREATERRSGVFATGQDNAR